MIEKSVCFLLVLTWSLNYFLRVLTWWGLSLVAPSSPRSLFGWLSSRDGRQRAEFLDSGNLHFELDPHWERIGGPVLWAMRGVTSGLIVFLPGSLLCPRRLFPLRIPLFPFLFSLLLMLCPLHLSPLSIFNISVVSAREKLLLDSSCLPCYSPLLFVFLQRWLTFVNYREERIPQGITEKIWWV